MVGFRSDSKETLQWMSLVVAAEEGDLEWLNGRDEALYGVATTQTALTHGRKL